ncbi:MAG: prepilin peptidase [Lachnospiraceae bacterium]|nr:prepilin peptidase [Lachnospiraceae bacterium]
MKIFSTIVFLFISIIINFFLLYKIDKKLFKISVIVIIASNIVFYLLDCFLIKNEFFDYLAFNMLLSFLLSVTFEDIKSNLMDTRVIVGYFILFLIYRIIFLDVAIFLEGLIGFGLSLIILLIAYFIKRNSIGIGDIEVIATCGMIIGFPNIFHFLFKAFLFVFIYGIFLMITKKKNTMTEIPLAPFLLLATIF